MSRPTHLAENLRRVRLARGWSQSEACARGALSLAGYRDLESGRAGPRASTLQRIADAFEVPVADLLRPVRALRHVRFRAEKRMKRRAQVLADVARRIDDRDELDAALAPILDAARRARFAPWMAADRVAEALPPDPREAAREARRAFGLDDRAPIHDLANVLEEHGIRVVALSIESDIFSGLALAEPDSPPTVVVNTWARRPVEAWIASAARGLGHLVLHPLAFDVDRTQEEGPEQRAADLFASQLLMPAAGFAAEWEAAAGLPLLERVLTVKRAFRVSWRLVAARAAERLPANEARDLWRRLDEEHARVAVRGLLSREEIERMESPSPSEWPAPLARRPEPAPLDARDFPVHRTWLLVRRAMESGSISLGRGAEILGLPLVEMRRTAATWVG